MKKERIRSGREQTCVYAGMNGAYWMLYCVAMAYAGVFLQSRGYSNAELGGVLAAGSVTGLVVPSVLAALADRGAKAPVWVMGIAAAVTGGLLTVLLLLPGRSLAVTVVFVLVQAMVIALQPLVNAFAFYLERLGIAVPFGLCRSVGSLAYAVVSAILGVLTVRAGAQTIPAAGLAVILGMGCLLVWFARGEAPPRPARTKSGGQNGAALLKNWSFLWMLAGTVLLFCGHAFVMNFTIQIVQTVGGDSGDMGGLAAYAAVLELPAMVLFDRLCRRFSCGGMLRFAAVFFAVKGAAVLIVSSMAGLYGALAFQALSFALFVPASVRYAGEISGAANANKAQAYVTAMITVGNILASAVGGLLIDGAGMKMALAVAAICELAGMLVMVLGVRNKQKLT